MTGRFKTSIIYLLTALISFFFGLFVLDQIILPHLAGGQRLTEVPDLNSLSVDEARVVCEKKGLSLVIQGETYHSQVPENYILRQDPEPGVVVKQGRQIYVMRSLGPEIVTVPYVKGLTQRQATILIERSSLEVVEVRRKKDPLVSAGRVIDISPPVDTPLSHGGKVILTVSEGVPLVKVPSVIDKDLEEARKILLDTGLQPGEIAYRYNSFIAEGRVIDQIPIERTEVELGSRVDLVVSGAAP